LLPGGLHTQRTEIRSDLLGVQIAKCPDNDFDLIDLAGRLPVGRAVVSLSVIEVGEEQIW
jgi:hypothetical protein